MRHQDDHEKTSLKTSSVKILADSLTLSNLQRALTPNDDEWGAVLTGPVWKSLRCVTNSYAVEPLRQSQVYFQAAARPWLDTMIDIRQFGNYVTAIAHSHPGWSAAASTPSGEDIRYLSDLQKKCGSKAIGIIVTRADIDGASHVRFYSVHVPFSACVVGEHIEQLENSAYECVYRLSIPKNN